MTGYNLTLVTDGPCDSYQLYSFLAIPIVIELSLTP